MMESSKQCAKQPEDALPLQPIKGTEVPESSSSSSGACNNKPIATASEAPPSYDAVPVSNSLLAPQAIAPPRPQGQTISDGEIIQPFAVRSNDGAESFMDVRLDTDPAFLEANIKVWAQKPPVFYMQVHGSHRESRTRRTNGRTETYTVTVTDFSVGVPLHGFLFGQPQPGQTSPPGSFCRIRTVENFEEVPRGTVRATRGPMLKDSEEPASEAVPKPTLQEWCHRYCASFAGHKTFVVERRVQGLDIQRLQANAMAIVRSTGFSGNVSITFESTGTEVEVLSSNKVNRWRRLTWLRIFCYVTFLWIFTWPFLYFSTKRFHCVYVEWPFSRIRSDGVKEYVSLTEDQMLQVWGKALFNAVMSRSTDFLNENDVVTAQAGLEPNHEPAGFGNSVSQQQYGWGRNGWGGSPW